PQLLITPRRVLRSTTSPSTYLTPLLYFFFFLILPPPPTSTLFPYTTLFRSYLEELVALFPSDPIAPRVQALLAASSLPEMSQQLDRKSTRLNSSHDQISYAVFCLKKKKKQIKTIQLINTTVNTSLQ